MKFDAKTLEKLLDSKFVSVVHDNNVPGVRIEKDKKGSFWVLINECTVEPKHVGERIAKALQDFKYTQKGDYQFQVTGNKPVTSVSK